MCFKKQRIISLDIYTGSDSDWTCQGLALKGSVLKVILVGQFFVLNLLVKLVVSKTN